MKRSRNIITLLAVAALLVAGSVAACAFSFSDINYWVGEGSNQAALVVDWNDGISPASIAWGYKWDGEKTGYDMLKAVIASQNGLFAKYANHSGLTVFGLGYDLDHDGFAYVAGDLETGCAADAFDHYKEGWEVSGYWSYNTIDGRETFSNNIMDWGYSAGGITGRALVNNSWDWWSYSAASAGWYGGDPDSPVSAVPEPSSIVALMSIIGLAGSAKLLRLPRK